VSLGKLQREFQEVNSCATQSLRTRV